MVLDPRCWAAILSVILVYFGASHLQTGKEGKVGPAGQRGEQGPPGPQGEPGPQGQTRILAKAYWFERETAKLEMLSAQYDKETQQRLEMYKTGTISEFRSAPPSMARNMALARSAEGIESQIKAMAKADFGEDIDLNKHLEFDQNHHLTTPGADQINDAFNQEEYRRVYNQYETSKGTISNLLGRYRMELDRYTSALADLARSR